MKYIVFFILTTLILNTKVSSQPFVRSWYTTWGNDSVPAEMNFVNQCADDFGNVYTHLTKDTVWNTTVSMITKYNSSGQRDWERLYYSPYDGRAYTTQIKCDKNGNVFLCGREKDATGNNTMLLLKYDSVGTFQWKFNYPFPIGQSCWLSGIDFDSLTNIYLLSTVYIQYASDQYEDILMTKLNPSGTIIWSNYMNFPDTIALHNSSSGIAADHSWNFIISGSTQDSSVFAKLDTSGNFIWVQKKSLERASYNLIVDDYNSIYTHRDSFGLSLLTKMDSTGLEIWHKNITQLDSCKINYLTFKKDHLYTAGDRGILKLDLNGDTLWRRHYVSGPGKFDEYKKVVVSENEDVTVVGNVSTSIPVYGLDLGISRYDSSGNLKWHLQYNNALNTNDDYKDVTLNSSDNLFVGSEQYLTQYCPQLICISPDTISITSDIHRNFQQSNDYSTQIVKDNSDNIIIAGNLMSSDLQQAIALVKYTNSGNLIWDKTMKKTNSITNIASLKTDDSDNIYIAGGHNTSITYKSEARLIKLDSNGDSIYQISHQLTPYCSEYFLNFVFDHSGNIYLLETGKDSSNLYFFQILKYDSSGNYVWNKFIADSAESRGQILVDEYDNIYYSYRTFGTTSQDWDVVVSMMDTAGNDIWTTAYNNPNNTFDIVTDMKLDHDKNIVLACVSRIVDWDLNVVKFDSTGQFLWSSIFNPLDLTIYLQYRLAIDENNNIYVSGVEDSTNVIRHGITIKLDPSGTFVWKNKMRANSSHQRNKCSAIAAGQGFVYVSGTSSNSDYSKYLFFVVYDTLGYEVYSDSICAPNSMPTEDQEGLQIIYDDGCAYLTGRIYTSAEEGEFSAIKYCNTTVGITETEITPFRASIYPNPSNGTFTIQYSSNESTNADVEVFNLLGERVLHKLVSVSKGKNEILISDLFYSGSYFVRIILNNNRCFSEKLIILN